ncbi:MAG: hypothetical protein PHG27_05870 [Massilibacteroides sp.]|nr:hypothetical protein [Massilibacteroides sp.]MDD3062993.1 hypothetical protein [Massilibacteroides sp.]MDD4115112.1 hypothetical protein [Massilibacteroides sp.]MDD4660984.1 hypothetical protein [Massilibacteroides sp.]
MDKLKDFIENNKQAFDEVELPVGHAERFREKLNTQRRTRVKRNVYLWIAVAACLGVLLTIRIQFQKNNAADSCELTQEIQDVRMYYNMQITAVVSEMEELYKQKQSSAGLGLLKESQVVLASTRDFENRIFPSLPCSEEALFAMSQHYDASITGMNILLKQMQNVTNEEKINN